MRKRWIAVLILGAMFLTGCGGKPERESEESSFLIEEGENGSDEEKGVEESKADGIAEGGEGIERTNVNGTGGEGEERAGIGASEEEGDGFLAGIQKRGYSVLEDDEAFYACNAYKIYKMNKEAGKWSVLWESEAAVGEEYDLDNGSAILVADTIYFTGRIYGKSSDTALFRIRTDGSGQECIDEFEKDMNTLFLKDGILYATTYGGCHAGYELKEDGSVVKLDSMERTLYGKVPENYSEPSYCNSDQRYFSVPESYSLYGFCLLYNAEYELVKFDPETGEETVVERERTLRAFNEDYLLFEEYTEDGRKWYLMDIDTMKSQPVAEGKDMTVRTMDENYIYWETEEIREEGMHCVYERMSIETGEITPFFEVNCSGDILSREFSPYSVLPPEIHDEYLYYVFEEDYKLYLKRRNIKKPAQDEVLGDAYYDSGISALGYLEEYKEKLYSEVMPDYELADIDLERLVIEEEFPGADEINRVLKEYQESVIAYAKDGTGDYREEVLKQGEMNETDIQMMQYSYWSDLERISYFDSNYVSFYLNESIYEGGAHGMPYRTGFTFDLKTGKRLTLPDLIGNSEQELKEIVTKYFKEYIDLDPDKFWEDAVDTVRMYTDYDSDFYLTEKGIRFYFGPYAIASYADGFQEVTIPYSEFDMKIPVSV